MKELVIISGKGGTGKTSVCAALATLSSREAITVFADCDVDAADLHLILSPTIRKHTDFISGHEAIIDADACSSCGKCAELCRFDAVYQRADGKYEISGCEGCGVCVHFCPTKAISFPERRCGEWYISDTRFGTLVHAQLDAEAENSGKLVSLVRKEARALAEEQKADYIIVDACPGIGCPVIASITGADAVLAVVEPSLSSKHDLERVIELARHFRVPLSVVINKFDINTDIALDIKRLCTTERIHFAGLIRYDTSLTAAQIQGKSIIEYEQDSISSQQIILLWKNIKEHPAIRLEPAKLQGDVMETLKIAIPLAEGRLTMHFGHCASFAIVMADVAGKKVISKEELIPPPHEPGLLPTWLGEKEVQLIIAGGMGNRAQDLFTARGIKVVTGAPCLSPEELVVQYLNGTLETGANGCAH